LEADYCPELPNVAAAAKFYASAENQPKIIILQGSATNRDRSLLLLNINLSAEFNIDYLFIIIIKNDMIRVALLH